MFSLPNIRNGNRKSATSTPSMQWRNHRFINHLSNDSCQCEQFWCWMCLDRKCKIFVKTSVDVVFLPSQKIRITCLLVFFFPNLARKVVKSISNFSAKCSSVARCTVAYLRSLKNTIFCLFKLSFCHIIFLYAVFLLSPTHSFYYRSCSDLMFDHLQP